MRGIGSGAAQGGGRSRHRAAAHETVGRPEAPTVASRAQLDPATLREQGAGPMSTYVVDYEDAVRPEWIDSNGHMNLA
ncbi:MAG: hypothetical protein J0H57_26355, partial [Rhodospirillales bacterium]|nr:hypothetical protein [Rhodospirillales bacterium]